jgi:uncharacterized protein YcbK (DUF882 family)
MYKRFATVAGILLAFHVGSAAAGPCDPEVQANQTKAEAKVQHVKADVAATPAAAQVLAKQAKVESASKQEKLEALVKPEKTDAPVKLAKAEATTEQAKAEAPVRHGGGNRRGLTPAMLALLDRIESTFGPVNVISGYRPGARIAGTGRISRHASGNAADIDVGGRKGAIVKWLIANHHNGGTMTYSDMGHIHVDIGQHFVSLGANSHRGGGRRVARSRSRDRYADSGYSRGYSQRGRSRSRGGYASSYQERRFASGYAAIYQ